MSSKNSQYSISDLAGEFQITTRTIRHYEEIGLLSPVRRGQTRVYSPADRTRLKLILRGKRCGLSLEESREIIDMYKPGKSNAAQLQKLLETFAIQREKLTRRLKDINNILKDIDKAEAGCLAELKAASK